MSGRVFLFLTALIAVLMLTGCAGKDAAEDKLVPRKGLPEILMSSPAFEEGGAIPTRHTCDGEDVSPALTWGSPPEGVKTFALICDDPDTEDKPWVHWVMYNIPGEMRSLPEALDNAPDLEGGIIQGVNDQRKLGYQGPCPPPGKPHRYYFKLYALDAPVELLPGASKMDLLKSIKGHILAKGQIMGTYQRN